MIKSVLIDLDDTIFDFHKSERCAISQTMNHFGIEPNEKNIEAYSEINDRQWKRLELGEISREEVLVGRFLLFFDFLKIKRDAKKARRFYEGALSQTYFFIDGAEELLTELTTDYSLYLASNGTDSVQTERIRRAGIEKYFKGIFISQRLGYDKPSIEYFNECFKRINNFTRDECIIIGDSLSSDIKGGINAGIKTCLFNPHGKRNESGIIPDFVVRKLSEIPALLKSN